MGENISMAKQNMLEWWDIFSMTGNIEDARMLMYSISLYDNLLLRDEEIELS